MAAKRLVVFTLSVAAVLGAVAAMALVGTIGGVNDGEQPGPAAGRVPETTTATSSLWPMNARGQTYGITVDNQEADLVRVVATNHKVGYSLRTELNGPTPSSPEEALRWQAEQAGKSRVVPVYESDGVTQIGVFRIGGPESGQ
ncbi:MAG: hypothetical protein Q8K89_02300 [Actinomycetota bacterium]|nr:hypothetical protein [Actinomycetota bacterium]